MVTQQIFYCIFCFIRSLSFLKTLSKSLTCLFNHTKINLFLRSSQNGNLKHQVKHVVLHLDNQRSCLILITTTFSTLLNLTGKMNISSNRSITWWWIFNGIFKCSIISTNLIIYSKQCSSCDCCLKVVKGLL